MVLYIEITRRGWPTWVVIYIMCTSNLTKIITIPHQKDMIWTVLSSRWVASKPTADRQKIVRYQEDLSHGKQIFFTSSHKVVHITSAPIVGDGDIPTYSHNWHKTPVVARKELLYRINWFKGHTIIVKATLYIISHFFNFCFGALKPVFSTENLWGCIVHYETNMPIWWPIGSKVMVICRKTHDT